jgi:WD40 repeat protein
MLRRVSGGHTEEITIIAFDYHLSLVATGCINGEITLYDFELSKVVGMLLGHTGDITALKFLSPYPMLVSASMDSSVCIWCVRGCPNKYLNVCVRRFENYSWKFDKDEKCTVTCI